MPDPQRETKCPKCGNALLEEKSYCPDCGLAVGSQVDRVAIDAYIQARIAQELSARMKDQASLVREIGDKAEDVVWGRLKRYGWVLAILTAILALWGIKSIDDAGNKIVETARQRVEPLIQNTEGRAKAAQEEIVKYEKQMQDYEARISNSGGPAFAKVESLKKSSDAAQKEISQLRETMNGQQKRLNETGALVIELQGKVVDLGKRELRAEKVQTTGPGPSYMAHGTLGCPSVAEALTKDGMLVAYCTKGTPPTLYQLTSTELRAVSSLSPVGFQDASAAPKPTCTAATRGTFYAEKGTGRTADKPFLCVKKSDNTYQWIQLGMMP